MSAHCRRPVSDFAGGGEECGEPVLPCLEKTCYDHAHVCQGPPSGRPELPGQCGEPTEYDQIFCPEHGDEVPTQHNES